jgi:hypothetical protein
MSQLVKTKRQANFKFQHIISCRKYLFIIIIIIKDFKRFGAFKGFVEQKNVVFNSFVCKLGLFWPNLRTNSLNKLLILDKYSSRKI